MNPLSDSFSSYAIFIRSVMNPLFYNKGPGRAGNVEAGGWKGSALTKTLFPLPGTP
jgi:hypothetical protein